MSTVNVSLDVRNFAASSGDGYTNTTASNNTVYSYQYSGGTDGHGNVDTTVDAGALSIAISLNSDPRYSISNVAITDTENQLSWAAGNSPTTATVMDSDSQTGSGYYQVIVSDNTAVCTFPCDPNVTNRPKPPAPPL
ncbi:MAG: hypothetical protein ABWX88_03475 [Pseudoxanthomonas sp.]